MKKTNAVTICIVVLLIIGTQVVRADYKYPPDWDKNDPSYTHQEWEFYDNSKMLIKPTDYQNPFGEDNDPPKDTPYLNIWGNPYWSPGPNPGDRGTWIDSIQGYGTYSMYIPNDEDFLLKKLVWLEVAIGIGNVNQAGPRDMTIDEISASCEAQGSISTLIEEELHGGVGMYWYTAIWELSPQPDEEWVGFNIAPIQWQGRLFGISEIDVDTICIPEPATICLLGLGGLALLRKRRA